MKTIKFILFAMFMLFASNVMANSFLEEAREPANTEVAEATPRFSLEHFGISQSSGYLGTTYQVSVSNGNINDYTFKWSIEGGDRSYVWPNANGTKADVSIYYSTSGSVRIVCEIYKNGSMVDAATDYLSF